MPELVVILPGPVPEETAGSWIVRVVPRVSYPGPVISGGRGWWGRLVQLFSPSRVETGSSCARTRSNFRQVEESRPTNAYLTGGQQTQAGLAREGLGKMFGSWIQSGLVIQITRAALRWISIVTFETDRDV